MNIPYTVTDIEVKKHSKEFQGGFKEASKFGLSCAVTWSEKDGYIHYAENDVGDYVEYLKASKVVVGFNLNRFDYRVLSGYTDFNFEKIPTFDILDEVEKTLTHRLRLKNLVDANIGEKREGGHEKASDWYKKGKQNKVKAYCENDVRITNQILIKAIKDGELRFWRWDNPNDPDTFKTDHWGPALAKLAGVEWDGENSQWNEQDFNDSIGMQFVDLQVRIRLKMRSLEPEHGIMTHEQEQAVLGVISAIESTGTTMKQVGSPVEIIEVDSHINQKFGGNKSG